MGSLRGRAPEGSADGPDPGNAGAAVVLSLLDGPRLEVGGEFVALPSRSARLLAVLGLRGVLPRSLVAGWLWPDVPEAKARASVRAAVADLQRRALPVLAATTGDLALAAGVLVDVRRLRELAEALMAPRPEAALLSAGMELVPRGRLGGQLLPGWRDEWVVEEAERLHQWRLHALDALVDHLCGAGRYAQAMEVALGTISVEPLRESTHRAVMRVFLAEGNVVAALRQFEKFRETVRTAVGIEPSRQMTDLVEQIAGGQRQPALSVVRTDS